MAKGWHRDASDDRGDNGGNMWAAGSLRISDADDDGLFVAEGMSTTKHGARKETSPEGEVARVKTLCLILAYFHKCVAHTHSLPSPVGN